MIATLLKLVLALVDWIALKHVRRFPVLLGHTCSMNTFFLGLRKQLHLNLLLAAAVPHTPPTRCRLPVGDFVSKRLQGGPRTALVHI